MKRYDDGELMEVYFIINKPAPDLPPEIKAWSDDKGLIEFYMEFHKCKHFKIKKIVEEAREMNKILEECFNDEIALYYATMRNKNDDRGGYYQNVPIPMTGTESNQVNAVGNDKLKEHINYSMMLKYFPAMKNKYRRALAIMLMPQIAEFAIYGTDPMMFTNNIVIDEFILLLRLFPNDFGK